MARAHLLLASAALLLAFLPGSQAVLCESFASKERCEGVNTDSGVCGWDAAAAKCAVVAPLPEGRVAITSLDQPAPQGNANAAGFEPCADKPTPEGFTCAQQKAWNKCNEAWMAQGGFCRVTCGVCKPGSAAAPASSSTAAAAVASPAPQPPRAGARGDLVETAGQAPPAAEPALDPSFCTLPRVTGPCRAAFPRWYYNASSGSCIPFIYGGCQGNANNFETAAACEAAAAKYCQPKVRSLWDMP